MDEPLQNYVMAQSVSPLTLFEGMMGLFDGKHFNTAQAAAKLGVGVVLILNMKNTAQTPIYIAKALASECDIKGVILNNTKSPNHEQLARDIAQKLGVRVLGSIKHSQELALASRHLGLVTNIPSHQLERMSSLITSQLDVDAIYELADEFNPPTAPLPTFTKPANNIAVARDEAFSFIYPWLLEGWSRDGADVSFFSPLADEAPNQKADFIYLPGGYPELHPELSQCQTFIKGMRQTTAKIYGECGGYMMLGKSITTQNESFETLGLLPFSSKIGTGLKALGYRAVRAYDSRSPFSPKEWKGHEFHYGETYGEEHGEAYRGNNKAKPLFVDQNNQPHGMSLNNVLGSFIHLIDSHNNSRNNERYSNRGKKQ